MTEFITQNAGTILACVLFFLAGNHLGQKIGFNDGLRRALEIMRDDTVYRSPLGDIEKL
ncbi:MAG: hypothetical protein HKM98_02515 [Gammaproteobacteria bacterium]|nr:hypothetical protein [Gammaproteobacteria bacterium]